MALHSDGSIIDCGVTSRRDGVEVRDCTVIGVTLDLLNGSIAYSFDDGIAVPVFGHVRFHTAHARTHACVSLFPPSVIILSCIT